MKNHLLGLTITTTLLSGCASAPPVDVKSLNYGEKPDNPLAIAERVEKYNALDAGSIQVKTIINPTKGYMQITGGVEAGWEYCYQVNGKNTFGGNTGWQYRYMLIRNNVGVYFARDNQAATLCSNMKI